MSADSMVIVNGIRYRRSFAERNGLLGEQPAAEAEGSLVASPPADKARTPRSATVKGGRAAKGAGKPAADTTPAPTPPPADGEDGSPEPDASPAGDGDGSDTNED